MGKWISHSSGNSNCLEAQYSAGADRVIFRESDNPDHIIYFTEEEWIRFLSISPYKHSAPIITNGDEVTIHLHRGFIIRTTLTNWDLFVKGIALGNFALEKLRREAHVWQQSEGPQPQGSTSGG